MFFSEPLLETIFGAQSADLCSESRFVVHFWISKGSKMDPRIGHFQLKCRLFVTLWSAGQRPGADPAARDPNKNTPDAFNLE